jgi:hypothetical protein
MPNFTLSSRQNWQEWLWYALLFLVPSNLFLKLAETAGYSQGLFIDYLIPKLYLTDVLIIGLGISLLPTLKKINLKIASLPLGFIGLAIVLFIRQLLTHQPISAIWYWIKLLEMLLLGAVIWKNQLWRLKNTTAVLVSSVGFQFGLALYQFLTQQSLFGYWFLGEPSLNTSYGLATTTWFGKLLTLPYGTTPHPNILAGWGVMVAALTLSTQKNARLKWLAVGLALGLGILTNSLAALGALGLILGWLWVRNQSRIFQKIWITLCLGLFILAPIGVALLSQTIQHPSVIRRDQLNLAAIEMSSYGQPFITRLAGVGLNHFTIHLLPQTKNTELVRFIQPVHHVGLLWWSETGFLGLFWLWAGWKLVSRKVTLHQLGWVLSCLVILASFDHYLLTSQTGLLELVLVLSFSFKKN